MPGLSFSRGSDGKKEAPGCQLRAAFLLLPDAKEPWASNC